jgi:hypothetical protein
MYIYGSKRYDAAGDGPMRRLVAAMFLAWVLMLPASASAQLFPPSLPASDPAPAGQQAPASPDFSAFAGGWWHHGFDVTINADGSGEASWRIYSWCSTPGTLPPCDSMQGNMIIEGGHATITFDHVESPTAFGTVTGSADQKVLPNGTARFTLREYGLGELTATYTATGFTTRSVLCGPHFLESPEWFRNTMPCGT